MGLDDSAILWQNTDRTITLIDIPQSIVAAQGTAEYPCNDVLLSTPALDAPYSGNEPKTKTKTEKLKANATDDALHAGYSASLQNALAVVGSHYQGDWCLARQCGAFSENDQKKKRKRAVAASAKTQPLRSERIIEAVSPSAPESEAPADTILGSSASCETALDAACADCCNDDTSFRSNCRARSINLTVARVGDCAAHNIRMPPFSSFYQGDCADSRLFHAAVRAQAQAHDTPRQFDFILMDPPWPNRSVKRSRKTVGGGYETSYTLGDIHQLLLGTDLDMLMADRCLVAVWITNKQSIRDLVLAEGGIFDVWGLELEEEWIWLKTTSKGKPVTALDSVWRRPYEVLLLGRRHSSIATNTGKQYDDVTRRVVVGVPDLHSRKPCFKQLVEPFLPKQYRALEVFSRHLVAGWWSWGNEATEVNHEDNWLKRPRR